MSFASNYLRCEGREIHYTEWGAQHAQTVCEITNDSPHWQGGLAHQCGGGDELLQLRSPGFDLQIDDLQGMPPRQPLLADRRDARDRRR